MAQTCQPPERCRRAYRPGGHRHRIGVAEAPRLRARFRHVLRDVDEHRNSAQAAEDPANPDGVADGLAEAALRDFEIPHRYGLRQTIGDTIGIGGIFRGLRTIPVLVDIAQDMAEACPQAWCLSYTDPMAMTTWAVRAATPFRRLAGLCHAVRDTHAMLAEAVGRELSDISFLTAGVNHQSFVLRFEADGRSLYPDLDARLADDPQAAHNVRAELYRRLGYFPTESSEHAAEYVPWFLRHDDQLARFAIPQEEYLRRSGKKLHAYEGARRALAAGRPLLIRWQHLELASEVITAMLTN